MNAPSSKDYSAVDDRLDRVVNVDIGGRGVEHLYAAARQIQGGPLVGAAADRLLAVEPGATVLLTTGSVSRAWISPRIGENDGPAGTAVVARALAIGAKAHCVLLCEEALIEPHAAIMRAAGLSVLSHSEAKHAARDGSLAAISIEAFPVTDAEAQPAAQEFLDRLAPTLLFSAERVGRAQDGIYYSMRGIDYGMGRSRVDHVFDEALRRKIPTVCVGDGGNEIGMGMVNEAVRRHVKFGDRIGAITGTDVLVTAACSNWGCSAIAAAMAMRLGDVRLLNTPWLERFLLQRGVEVGLINSVANVVDPHVDGIDLDTHVALVTLLKAIVTPHMQARA